MKLSFLYQADPQDDVVEVPLPRVVVVVLLLLRLVRQRLRQLRLEVDGEAAQARDAVGQKDGLKQEIPTKFSTKIFFFKKMLILPAQLPPCI